MRDPRSPVLEMLWEAHDPNEALEGRFGFGHGEAAGRWIAATLDEHWGVRVHACERVVISAHNALAWVDTASGRLVAKWSVSPARYPRLLEVARLTHWLHERGLPVSPPIPARDGSLQVEVDGVSMGLQREVEGDLLDTGDPDQVRAAGATLARLQDALAAYPDTDRVAALAEPPRPLAEQILDWLNSDVEHVPATARDSLRRLVADAPLEVPPRQLVHLDFRSANIFCVGAEITAVIDFEEASVNHRIVELARAAVLLGTRFRGWGPISADVRAGFLAGYESVRPLTPLENAWWDVLLLWYSLAMVPAGDDPTGWGTSALSHLATLSA